VNLHHSEDADRCGYNHRDLDHSIRKIRSRRDEGRSVRREDPSNHRRRNRGG
jgi:hypothetical protein